MCGIIAYAGVKPAVPILLNGMRNLEYRGYDSTGIALLGKKIEVYKALGRSESLCDKLPKNSTVTFGMGHTRWASFGEVGKINAHPQLSYSGNLAIVHNGQLENTDEIQKILIDNGFTFESTTDTEIFVNYVEYIKKKNSCCLEEALGEAFATSKGLFAVVMMDAEDPFSLVVGRKGSPPVVIGKTDCGYIISSDAYSIKNIVNGVHYLDDEDLFRVSDSSIQNFNNKKRKKISFTKLEFNDDSNFYNPYRHYMLKEIFDQPEVLEKCLNERIDIKSNSIRFTELEGSENYILNSDSINIIACSSSWHSALLFKYWIESFCDQKINLYTSSEFLDREIKLTKKDLLIAISHSGETFDTVSAVNQAKKYGIKVLSIYNIENSTLSRISDFGICTRSGNEVSIPSTKSLTTQMTTLFMLVLWYCKSKKYIDKNQNKIFLEELLSLPSKVSTIFNKNVKIALIARSISKKNKFIYTGRNFGFPIALEGAFKLKLITNLNVGAYQFAEIKHGPLSIIDSDAVSIVLGFNSKTYSKILGNTHEIITRHGKVISIVSENDTYISQISDYSIEIPKISEELSPILSVIPLQLLAYFIGLEKNCNIDYPRNLAKFES